MGLAAVHFKATVMLLLLIHCLLLVPLFICVEGGGGGGDGGVVFGTYFEIQYLESIFFFAFNSLRKASF